MTPLQALHAVWAVAISLSALLRPQAPLIPLEADAVDTLLLSVDDIDILENRGHHHFLDLWTLAIREANTQGINVYVHVTAKSSKSLVVEELQRRGLTFTVSDYRTDSVWIRDYG